MAHTLESLATQYISGQAATPTMRELMDFHQWVDTEFARIERRVVFTEAEVSPEEMEYHWDHFGLLKISTAHNEHPYWGPEINAKFRAIHDWDHVTWGHGYDWVGEIRACQTAMAKAPESIHWILWSEIALQAAAAIHTGEFQPQKLVK